MDGKRKKKKKKGNSTKQLQWKRVKGGNKRSIWETFLLGSHRTTVKTKRKGKALRKTFSRNEKGRKWGK